jgi:hypothetical protein
MMFIYADDCLTIGTYEATYKFIEPFNFHGFEFKIRISLLITQPEKLFRNSKKGRVWIIQTHLINNFRFDLKEIQGM